MGNANAWVAGYEDVDDNVILGVALTEDGAKRLCHGHLLWWATVTEAEPVDLVWETRHQPTNVIEELQLSQEIGDTQFFVYEVPLVD